MQEQTIEEMDNARLTEMEQKIDKIGEKLDGQDKKLGQVVDAILGNPLTKAGGFISDLAKLDARVTVLEKKDQSTDDFKKKAAWTLGGLVGLAIMIKYFIEIYVALK